MFFQQKRPIPKKESHLFGGFLGEKDEMISWMDLLGKLPLQAITLKCPQLIFDALKANFCANLLIIVCLIDASR